MTEIIRKLKINLSSDNCILLLGARKVGKSTFLRSHFPESAHFSLLMTDLFQEWEKAPWKLRQEVLALPKHQQDMPIIVDEVQKIPALLDEVHWLIEEKKLRFVLCGSSARKLKRSGVNLLGGRAVVYRMHPLSASEVPEFDLLRALQIGLLPQHYLSASPKRLLKSYISTYLEEEIRQEALSRNLPGFSKFLTAAALSTGNILNYTNLARESGVSSKTVKEYFQILEDTLVGTLVPPLGKSKSRQVIFDTPKFYFFDTGLHNGLKGTMFQSLSGFDAGQAFEHWVLMELKCYFSYALPDEDFEVFFWKTKQGEELDFVLNDIGFDVVLSSNVSKMDIKGTLLSIEQLDLRRHIVVTNERARRMVPVYENSTKHLELLPWRDFIEELWGGKLFIIE